MRHDEIVIYDQGPSELPTATLLPKSRGLALLGGLQRWLIARWSWLAPRTIPVAVAALSLIILVVAVDGLWHAGDRGIRLAPHATVHLGR
jgi:hypothetical protein